MERHRVQLSFNDKGFDDLNKMEKEMNVTRQELFRYALKWLQWTTDKIRKGGEMQVKDKDGTVKTVVAPFL